MIAVAAPIFLGALIGYVTNWLAIKMLFWPREEKFFFGRSVPFTPGLFVRRRQDFSASVSRLVERKFANADDLYALVQRSEDEGLLDEFLSAMGPVFRISFQMYMRKSDPEDFKRDCRKIAVGLRRARIVSNTVRRKIDEMPVMDIETMVLGVIQRELRAITWFGGLLGAAIGALQIFL
jgi:uncharacterized membrane protein YheB (UPF0754 family)